MKDKAPWPNSITNKVLRIATLIIPKELAQININYLATGLPDRLKKSFTFVLRKKEKKNYLLSGAYRPIVLKIILVKLAEKVIITRNYKEDGSGAIINIKLIRREKTALYFLSNKLSYLNYLDCVEN